MKGLLRSVIDYGGITQDNLIANFQKLTQSRIEWPHPADKRIYQFLRAYFNQRLELPSKQTIIDHFEAGKDQESVERVSDHETVAPYSRTNFTHLLHETLEEQNRVRAITVLKESQEIITKGLIVDDEKKQGLRDGVLHFARNTHRLLVYEHNSRVDGNICEDGQEVWDEYQDAKLNKGKVLGKFCGINGIDSIVKGIKKGEMWVHAAFVGELKCLSGDSLIFDHKTQRRRSLKEMFDCGDLPTVTALAEEGNGTRLQLAEASHLVQNGEREVFDLTLISGRTLGATSNHRFLTPSGWKELSELASGDFVATPKVLAASGAATYSADEVKLVGYLIGRDPDSKRIPGEFFGLPENLISVLLGALWSTGDFRSTGDHLRGETSAHKADYVSVNRGLCLDIQSLLLRLGIQSTVTRSVMQGDTEPYPVWITRVTNSGKQFGVDTGDIYWDRVDSIVTRGLEMTYDLSVPGPHTFVANDIITHNTTFSLNWAYSQVTRYKNNVFYVTLEMPYEQLRSMIYVMHSSNGKWKAQGYTHLDYDKVKSGDLTREEEEFYQKVIKDFNENESYGDFEVWGPDEDITIDEVQQKVELKHQEIPIHLLIIDHGGLLEPRRRKRNKDYTVELNSVLRDTKKLALHFNHGEKIPILVLFQINRDGKDFADKNEGRYKLRSLSYSNEAERSADVVSTTYLNDEYRKEGTVLFDCLKRRDGVPFQPFKASVNWATKRINNFETFHGVDERGISTSDLDLALGIGTDSMFQV